jgi:hypothetical protein
MIRGVALLLILAAAAFPQRGFQPLFNGKDLQGWHKNPQKIGHGTGGSWRVENGVIVGEQDPPGSGNGGILLSDEKFGNFEVIFEVWPDWGVDSGFFLRSTDTGKCYQVMIDYHEDGNVGEIYREGLDGVTNRTFLLQGVYEDAEKTRLKEIRAIRAPKTDRGAGGAPVFDLARWNKIWRLNGWNTIRARVEGNPPTITTWVNGTEITRYVSDKKFEGVLGDTGSVAVQVHGGKKAWPEGAKIRFRNIRVKPL